jgi:hypothetical protein
MIMGDTLAVSKGIEIYVRPSGDRVLLNIYVPERLRETFSKSLRKGSFEQGGVPINLEFTTLPHWATDPHDRARLRSTEPAHMRVALTAINIQFVAEDPP